MITNEREEGVCMYYIDIEYIEQLAEVFNRTVEENKEAIGSEEENLKLFKMNFIKNFSEDVMFLNDNSGNDNFQVRYADLIIRNMLEQLLEYLYISKNTHLLKEYLGEYIKSDFFEDKYSVIEKTSLLGEKRFVKKREKYFEMARDLGEYESTDKNTITLYGLYKILSEQSHNSYFGSLMNAHQKMREGNAVLGLTLVQVRCVHILIEIVLRDFD